MNVQPGQYDCLLTVRTEQDVAMICNAIDRGVNIRDQVLNKHMRIQSTSTGPPSIPPAAAPSHSNNPPIPPPSQNRFSQFDDRSSRAAAPPPTVSTSPPIPRNRSQTPPELLPPEIRKSKERERSREHRDRDRDSHRSSRSHDRRDRRDSDRRGSSPTPPSKRSRDHGKSHEVPEVREEPGGKLTAKILKEEIEKRRKALADLRKTCEPAIEQVELLYPMKKEYIQLMKKRDQLSRKRECVVLALDEKSEPYMAWLVMELKKRSTPDLEFRVEGIKAYETTLSNPEAYTAEAFEEGTLMVVSVNEINEAKRSVTIHLCMNELNQIHKNMQVRDALQMIQEQWDEFNAGIEQKEMV